MSNNLGGLYIKPNIGDSEALRIDGTSTSNILYVNNAGKVIVNGNSPTALLEVKNDTSGVYSFRVTNNDGLTGDGLLMVGKQSTKWEVNIGANLNTRNSSDSALYINKANVRGSISGTQIAWAAGGAAYWGIGQDISGLVASSFDSFVTNNTAVFTWGYGTDAGTTPFAVLTNTGLGVGITIPTAKGHFKGSDATSSNFAFKADNSASSPLLCIRNDERVGIRNTSPAATLHISGISAVDPLRVHAAPYGASVFTVDSVGKISETIYGDWAHTISATSNSSISGISAGLGISTGTASGSSTSTVNGIYAQNVASNFHTIITTSSAIYGYSYGGTNMINAIGVNGLARLGTTASYALKGLADDASPANYGVHGISTYATVNNYAGYFDAANSNPSNTAGAYGIRAISSNYKNNGTVYGAYITATNTNNATTGIIYGLYVDATTTNGTSTNYALVTNGGNSGFGTTTPNTSAIVDMSSTTQGFLPPRMTGTQAEAITSPATGLLIYSTDGSGSTITSAGWWGYNGSTWEKLN